MTKKIYKKTFTKPDGRAWNQYSHEDQGPLEVIHPGKVRPGDWKVPTLRWNKMRGEHVAVSASRTNRPLLPSRASCPLCPPADLKQAQEAPTEIPLTNQPFKWAAFENMFPSLSLGGGTGYAEVLLYSSSHDKKLSDQPLEDVEGLVKVWMDRSATISRFSNIKHVFIFENKGEEVGVTLHHPHGQIYAFCDLPPFIRAEWEEAKKHFAASGNCLICDLASEEIRSGERTVFDSDTVVAYVPYAARYPFEVHVTTKRHCERIENLEESEISDIARCLKTIIHKYDGLYGFELPYMMVHHQGPHHESSEHYHWHLEFYPVHRGKDKIKFLAGVESGAGLFVNDTLAEESAKLLNAVPQADF